MNNNFKKFEFFEVTADVGIKAYGNSLDEAFENAALAMFEVMTNTSSIKQNTERRIQVESEDECALLYDWLSEFLVLLDSEYLVFSKFKAEIKRTKNGFLLEGTAWGEEFDLDVHESRAEVKAVTYHLMNVKKNDLYRVKFILDI